jgi:MFS family permease
MSLVTFLGIYFVRRVGIDLATVGAAFLCEHGLRGALAPVFGALSDRIGRRALLLASSFATAVVLPSFLLVAGPAGLFAWSLAMGVVGAVNIPVSNALLLDLAPAGRRQSVLALNYTLMSVAYTLGVSPAGYIAEKGYELLAFSSSLGFLMVGTLYALALRKPLPLEKSSSGVLRNTVSAFRDGRFALFAAMAFVFPLSMGMVVAGSPVFGAEMGLGEGYIGLVLGGNSIIVALLAIPAASRMEAKGPFRLLGGAAALVSAALFSYALIPGAAAALLVGTVVFSLGEVVFSSAVPAAVAGLAPAGRRGAYQGGWALVSSFCMGSALVLSGWLKSGVGWQGAWLAYATVALAAALALFAARRRFLGQ